MSARIEGRIITAWAETCTGPGWHSRIVWILVMVGPGVYRVHAIQPEDQTPGMHTLFDISETVSRAMTAVVRMSHPEEPDAT